MNEQKFVETETDVCLTHTDVDGYFASALVAEVTKKCKVIPQDPSNPFPKIKAKRKKIIITDISITEKTYGSLGNLEAEEIIWIDHHRPFVDISSLAFPGNVQVIVDPSSPSATLLVQKYFALNDEKSNKIVEIATKSDRWQIDNEVQQWMDIVTAWNYYALDPNVLVNSVLNLEITEYSGVLEKYRKEKESAKQFLKNNSFTKDVKGHLISFGLFLPILNSSESADFLGKIYNSEVQIVIREGTGWVSFRRAKNSTVNLITIAKLWNGGGHEYASGATLNTTVTTANFKAIAEEMAQKIAQVL